MHTDSGSIGLVLTLLGMIFAGLGILLGSVMKLGRILQRFESIEERWEKNVEALPLIERRIAVIEGALVAATERVARHDSSIVELREAVAGLAAAQRYEGEIRRSQGEYGR